jgi:hypothetical protein
MPKGVRKEAPKGLSVYDRRVANPLGKRSRDIPLAEHLQKEYKVRVFTRDAEHPDRHYEAVHELGYIPCKPEDLGVDPTSLGFTVNPEGYVVRGDKGQDLVARIPRREFQRIQRAKSDANLAGVKAKKLKDDVSQATAKVHGAEAGDIVHQHYEQREVVEVVGTGGMGE